MDIFDVLTLIGGLCLFLFGMNLMGQALERRAGNKLKTILGKLTTNRFLGFLTGFIFIMSTPLSFNNTTHIGNFFHFLYSNIKKLPTQYTSAIYRNYLLRFASILSSCALKASGTRPPLAAMSSS